MIRITNTNNEYIYLNVSIILLFLERWWGENSVALSEYILLLLSFKKIIHLSVILR